jgi:outer membrane lipopolysaccharide assembly protein LptE/RlpB
MAEKLTTNKHRGSRYFDAHCEAREIYSDEEYTKIRGFIYEDCQSRIKNEEFSDAEVHIEILKAQARLDHLKALYPKFHNSSLRKAKLEYKANNQVIEQNSDVPQQISVIRAIKNNERILGAFPGEIEIN